MLERYVPLQKEFSSMRLIAFLLFIIVTVPLLAQKSDIEKVSHKLTSDSVSFTTRFYLTDLDKDDAANLKGYVVYIGIEQAKKLNGKRIRVSGKVTMKKGNSNRQPGQPIPQERQGDYKYIESPTIEIIEEQTSYNYFHIFSCSVVSNGT
ncbi:MAG: hypothetical protein U0T79_05390 [Ferruginibacter sp.]